MRTLLLCVGVSIYDVRVCVCYFMYACCAVRCVLGWARLGWCAVCAGRGRVPQAQTPGKTCCKPAQGERERFSEIIVDFSYFKKVS